MDYDYSKIESIKSFRIKYGSDNDFKKVKIIEDDIYDLVKRVGIPVGVEYYEQYIF